MKLGIFGGSFNPPHNGHLIVIESVRDALKLDRVIFIPSSQTPNKISLNLAPPIMRYEMTKLAVKGNLNFEVSDTEIKRKGVSYTVDTLNEFALKYPGCKLSLIIGSDNLIEFSTWRSPDEILQLAELIVMSRYGFSTQNIKSEYSRYVTFVNVPQIGISGTDIRRRVRLGKSIRYLVPKDVEEYIFDNHLYKE
jgi:nicotinate-nucleotide adenylyltransferase